MTATYEILKRLPGEGSKGRESLNNFLKRVRSGQLSLEELLGSICAFEEVIYWRERVSPAWGGLLSNLFAQVEANWRGEAFNTDIRSVQLVLLKKLFKEEAGVAVAKGNLVIWTAALKEIRMLSGQAKEWAIGWVLRRCKREAEDSDWPVIFHNLICMSQGNGLPRIFEGICECSSKALVDHLIFLIGQNGNLGKSWIKWITGKGCFGIDPLMFSGLLILSQDIEYFHVLNAFMFNQIKLMKEIREITMKSVDPGEFLSSVANFIGSDSEAGIKGALQLIENLKADFPDLSEKFFLELYKKHPFARRELLKSESALFNTKAVYEIDPIIFKEHFKSNLNSLKEPELISKVVENEDEAINCDLNVLLEIDSVLLNKALKNSKKSDIKRDKFNYENVTVNISNWDECSYGQIFVLKSQVKKEEMTAKFVELSELLLVPGGIGEGELREELIELAIEFVSQADGFYSKKEKILMISKLISASKNSEECTRRGGSYSKVMRLFDDWSSFEGTMKFLLERISEASEEFYEMAKQTCLISSVEMINLFAKTVTRIEEVELRDCVVNLISTVAGRVVSEPQLTKALTLLLSKKYSKLAVNKLQILHKFTEISEPNLIKLVCEWGLEYGVEGMREEMIKSVLMFYGIIELNEDEQSSNNDNNDNSNNQSSKTPVCNVTTSRFKNFHLNEKSINFVLTILLNELQVNLGDAHKLIKNYFKLFEEEPDEFMRKWVFNFVPVLLGLTKGLISGKGAIKLYSLLASFYNLCQKMLSFKCVEYPEKLRELTRIVGGQLNKQVYALIPLQQEKIQTILKQEMNLKKAKGPSASTTAASKSVLGKSVTDLIFEMERFEETLISVLRERPAGEKGWCEKIVRSTARDFKIKLEQL